ncbi:SPOR domain-containing protein [Candidatus Parabeggiatoa sp. HSG14]|uniref:SPOR domain-containing protein n=1 Tax=Candidatus Parabeggiatoa sp. HSG14 TaxID=3055593 RepID=UPI0025A8FC64|nr:SPOR domain-containing protein [Thiotrichales bacterium HSG14]
MAMRKRHTRNPDYVSPTCPPGWAWLLAGIVIGMFISFLIYLREIAPYTLPSDNAQTPLVVEKTVPTSTVKPSEPVDRFQFYDILPNTEVEILPETGKSTNLADPSSQADLPIQNPGRYLLRVGSFENEQQAEGLKNHLTSLGITAQIEKTPLSDTGRWYRVQVGPFTDLNKLNETRAKLAANNIRAILLKF